MYTLSNLDYYGMNIYIMYSSAPHAAPEGGVLKPISAPLLIFQGIYRGLVHGQKFRANEG
jgi:hypothetical protein